MRYTTRQFIRSVVTAIVLGLTGGAGAGEEPETIVLEQVVIHPHTYATSRHRLSSGGFVQLTSGCSEWSAGGDGYYVFWDEILDDWYSVRFPSGPYIETPTHLIVEAHQQVGSDATDEPPRLPDGCRHRIYDSTGSIFCTEVLAIDLSSGAIQSAGYDTYAPIATGTGRFVVLSVAGTDQTIHHHIYGRDATEMRVWDLTTGHSTHLGELSERPHVRASSTEVFARLGHAPDYEYSAVDGSTGAVRVVPAEEAAIPDRTYRVRSSRRSSLVAAPPARWITTDGRRIEVWADHRETLPTSPQYGSCGLDGPYWADGLLFTDLGIYRWPESIELASFAD